MKLDLFSTWDQSFTIDYLSFVQLSTIIQLIEQTRVKPIISFSMEKEESRRARDTKKWEFE